MPIRYIKNPPTFEARLFMGDRENATDIGSWLADHEIHSAWYDAVESVTVEPHEDAAEGTPPLVIPARPQRLVLEFDDGDVEVLPGTWIVIDEHVKIQLHTEASFNEAYSIAPDPIRF